MNDENPFASPQTSNDDYVPELAIPDDAERIRREYFFRESNIKSLGFIFLLGCILFALGTVVTLFSLGRRLTGDRIMLVTIIVTSLLSVAHAWIGRGLRRLNLTVRYPAIAFCALWLIYFYAILPVVISVVGFFLLIGQKAQFIFSPEYKQIIAATPQVKHKTSMIMWVLLILLAGLFVLSIVGLLVEGF